MLKCPSVGVSWATTGRSKSKKKKEEKWSSHCAGSALRWKEIQSCDANVAPGAALPPHTHMPHSPLCASSLLLPSQHDRSGPRGNLCGTDYPPLPFPPLLLYLHHLSYTHYMCSRSCSVCLTLPLPFTTIYTTITALYELWKFSVMILKSTKPANL